MNDMEWWVCRKGHRIRVRKKAVAAWCGVCANTAGFRGSNEMKPEKKFPSWADKS